MSDERWSYGTEGQRAGRRASTDAGPARAAALVTDRRVFYRPNRVDNLLRRSAGSARLTR